MVPKPSGRPHPERETLLRGACSRIKSSTGERSTRSWTIDHGKDNGASLGFRVRVEKRKYMLKTTSRPSPNGPAPRARFAPRSTRVGFNTSCEQVIFSIDASSR